MSNRDEASTSQAGGDPPPIDKEVLKTSFLEMLSDPTIIAALASAASGAATKGGQPKTRHTGQPTITPTGRYRHHTVGSW